MFTLNEKVAALIAVVYGLFGLSILFYTNRMKKQLDRYEELSKQARAAEVSRRANESTHKSDPTQPLLGVVYPADKTDA